MQINTRLLVPNIDTRKLGITVLIAICVLRSYAVYIKYWDNLFQQKLNIYSDWIATGRKFKTSNQLLISY